LGWPTPCTRPTLSPRPAGGAGRARPALLSYLGIPDSAGLDERRWHRELVGRAIERTDRVVALSHHAAAAFSDSFGYDAPVIAPGVDTAVFAPGPERDLCPTILCSADAAEPRKHVGLLIAAFALVRSELPDARLVLSAPRRLAGGPGVEWVDLDDQLTLAAAYRNAWVTALPSESEAFGLVLAESLACGTPVVGYADGAIAEIVDSDRIGRLFAELTAPALAEALLQALELSAQPSVRAHCRDRGLQFSSERCVQSYLALYDELLGS
jgi:glycosyltransferase involved in cell wall biosynthesis